MTRAGLNIRRSSPVRVSTGIGPGGWIATAIFFAVLPLMFNHSVQILILNQMGTAIIFALSYNLLLGGTGLLSLGHAVYFGFGGFLAIHAMRLSGAGDIWLPAPLVPLAGGLMGFALALMFGKFSTKVTGIIFAMVSLALAELVMASSSVLGRYYGGSVNRTLMPSVFGLDFSSEAEVYGVTALWTFVVLLAVWFFLRTPLGIMAKAVGENSDRSTFIGYDPRRVKFFTFCFSGFLAGIGGGLFALTYEFVAVETISLSHSWQVLQMVFIGGIGHFAGPVIGAVALTLLFSVLSGYTEVWNLYVGIVFIAMVILAPGGLSDLVSKLFNLVRARGVRGVGLPALGLAFGLMTVTAGMAAILEPLYALSKKVKRTGTYFDNSEAVFSFTGLLVFGVFLLCLGGYGCRKFLARLSGQS